MNGIMKNQTVKRWYTVTVTDEEGTEIDSVKVMAESAREAVNLAYPNCAKTGGKIQAERR